MKDKLVIVHHDGDNDGLMGGTLATVRYKKMLEKDEALIFGYDYQPEHEWMNTVNRLLEDTTVTMEFIDISPYLPWLETMKTYLEDGLLKIKLYDHHKLKHDDIMALQLPNITSYFDDEFCGSMIYYNAWVKDSGGNLMNNRGMNYVFASIINHYVKLVDAWDTWKFVNLPGEEQTILAFNETFMLTKTVSEFYNMMMDHSYVEIINRGMVIVDYQIRNVIPSMLKNSMITSTSIDGIEEHTQLPVLMIQGKPSYYAEQFLNETFKDKKFVVLYYNMNFTTGEVKLSLRNTVKGTFDCAKLARSFDPNGGGHADAAGCTMTFKEFMPLINNAITDSEELSNKKLLEELPVKGFDSKIIKRLMIN